MRQHGLDFSLCPRSGRFYAGVSQKVGILIDGKPYVAKLAHGGCGMPSAIVEYAASQTYRHLGFDVQDAILGVFEGNLACACSDVAGENSTLVEFFKLRNSLPDDLPGFVEAPSFGRGRIVEDVIAAVDLLSASLPCEELKSAFWRMMAVDALLGISRSSAHWGILRDANGTIRPAPVFSNGHLEEKTNGLLKNGGMQASLFDAIGRCPCKEPLSAVDHAIGRFDVEWFFDLVDRFPETILGVPAASQEMKEDCRERVRCRFGKLRATLGTATA